MGLLNRIGIGSAEVDTILERQTVQPGEDVPARIEIKGGSDDQEVEAIDLAVMTRYEIERGDAEQYKKTAIHKTQLTDGFTVTAGEERTMDAGEIHIPESTPPTIGKQDVWVYTGLDIDWSVDPKDKDFLDVQPGPRYSAMLDAIENLGFQRYEVEHVKMKRFGPHEFGQELEYRPRTGPYQGKLDEIELFPVRTQDQLELLVEVDKRGVSFMDLDESHHRMTVTSTDPEQIEQRFRSLIDEQL